MITPYSMMTVEGSLYMKHTAVYVVEKVIFASMKMVVYFVEATLYQMKNNVMIMERVFKRINVP